MTTRRSCPSTPPLAAGIAALLLAACSGGGGEDATPPTTPAALTVASLSPTTAALTWSAATDDVAVTGYEVLRDGAAVRTTTGLAATDTGLAPSTRYCWAVRALDAAGNRSAASPPACATTPAPDLTAPVVLDMYPGPGAVDVPATAAITATFDEPVDPATLPLGFTLVDDTTDTLVPAVVTWDAAALTATLTPSAPLHELEAYTASVGTAVTDLAGNPLATELHRTFRIALKALQVVARTPAPGSVDAAPAAVFTARFDEAVDPATLQGGGFTLRDESSVEVPAVVTCDDPCLTATLTPSSPLVNLRDYTAIVTTAVTATSGHVLAAEVSWTVRVEAKRLVLQPGAGGAAGEPCAPVRFGFADFDADGHLDAAFVCADANVYVARGDGAGGFGAASTIAVGPRPGFGPSTLTGVVAADLDGDGHPDLATSEQICDTSRQCLGVNGAVDVIVNDRNAPGTFRSPARLDVGVYPNDVVAADLDGDGRLDLASADLWSSQVSVLLQNANGTFRARVAYDVTTSNTLVADALRPGGAVDLVPAAGPVLLGDGAGVFAASATAFEPGPNPVDVAAGDLDGSGVVDLAVANDGTDHVTLLQGDAAGGFPAASALTTGSFPGLVRIADLNGDGWPDLLVALRPNGIEGTNTSVVLLGRGFGAFAAPADLGGRAYAAVDLDGDGRLDLVGSDLSTSPAGFKIFTWMNATP